MILSFAPPRESSQRKRGPEKTTGSVYRHLRQASSRSKKPNPVRTFSGQLSHRITIVNNRFMGIKKKRPSQLCYEKASPFLNIIL